MVRFGTYLSCRSVVVSVTLTEVYSVMSIQEASSGEQVGSGEGWSRGANNAAAVLSFVQTYSAVV